MEFTLQSAFSPQGMLGHTAYLLLVASMLMRRMLYLRLLVIASALVSIAYTAFVLNDPVSTFWESLLIATNILQITRNWLKERRAGFTAEELVLAHKGLPGLPLAVAGIFDLAGNDDVRLARMLLALVGALAIPLAWLLARWYRYGMSDVRIRLLERASPAVRLQALGRGALRVGGGGLLFLLALPGLVLARPGPVVRRCYTIMRGLGMIAAGLGFASEPYAVRASRG